MLLVIRMQDEECYIVMTNEGYLSSWVSLACNVGEPKTDTSGAGLSFPTTRLLCGHLKQKYGLPS
jgi:hypothetical protein